MQWGMSEGHHCHTKTVTDHHSANNGLVTLRHNEFIFHHTYAHNFKPFHVHCSNRSKQELMHTHRESAQFP